MSVAPLQLLKSEFNPLVYVFLDNATDKLVSGAYFYGTTGTTPSDAYFTKGALLVHATDGTLYQNSADDGDTPSWGLVGGGGGVAIGDAITDADAGSILYVDGTGNLTQGTGFTRTSTGVTNISSTFGGNTFGYQIGDNLLGYGITGSANTLTNVAGDSAFNGIYRDNVKGDLYSKNEIVLSDGSMVSEIIDMGTFANAIYAYNGSSFLSGTSVIASDSISIYNDVGAGNELGFFVEEGTLLLGNRNGGNSTKITIDDANEQITITNVPTYANDAAAITGGLTTGMLYKTTTGGITALNIVP